jgi:hypothetical protein
MIPKPFQRSCATRLLGLALSALLTTASLRAETSSASAPVPTKTEASIPRFAIGGEIGTVGWGPVVVLTASKHFTANLGYTWFNYDYDYSDTDGDYKAKAKLSNIQAIANWHPFAGTFHLSAGAFLTDNKVDMTAVPSGNKTYEIGDGTYTAAQVGTLAGTAVISDGVAPFLGLGWAKSPGKSGFGFYFDVGILFIDAPTATFYATGPIANDPNFKANLRKEEQSINDDLSSFEFYPVIKMGFVYRF